MTSSIVRAAGGVPWRVGNGGEIEVVLCFRPRYGDWTIPKGKVEEGESLEAAALREIEEETLITGQLGDPLGSLTYVLDDRSTKEVHYWLVGIVDAMEFSSNEEVSELFWGTFDEAIARATYEGDRDILRRAQVLLGK
ncbi:MAG: NUDIX hydrolase [Acidimicrobiales bacterium]